MEVYIYFPLVYFSFIQDSWSYFVSNTTATWTEEDAECKMATPTILYEGLKLDMTIDKPIPNLGVWVGYYERMALFDYIGCIKTHNAPATTSIQLHESTPGRCYSACSYSQYIGIEKPNCYCFDTEPGKKITEQECNEPCDDMSQTVCGGTGLISLYRISTNDTNDTDIIPERGQHKCLQINFKDGEKYNWRDCKNQMWASCISDSTQPPVEILEEEQSWNDAAKLCFQHKSYPTRFVDISQITDDKKYFWTGVVRSGVISKSTELGNISSDIMYGYMTYTIPSGYVLKFTQENDKKYILCENATVTVKPNTPMRTSITTTQEYQPTTSRNDSSDNSTNTQSLGATVIVIVSVSVVMLIIIVVVILIQVKRKKIPFLCQREPTTEEPGQKHLKSTKTPTSHENHSYELADVEDNVIGGQSADSNYTHTYNVLEEHVKDSITDNTTYDVSGNNRKTTETENENIYNKLKPGDNATYDHAYNTTKHGLQPPDITYGTSGNGGMKPLARAAKYSDAFDENGESAYSHTLDNRSHMTTTDNVYSAHGQAGNDTRNTGEGHNDTEDAYSQINNATNGRSKQDIAYGKITEGNLKENSEGDYDVTDEHSCRPNVDNEY